MLAITLIFIAFVAGFYLGRSSSDSPIHINGVVTIPKPTLPSSTQSLPSTTVPATLDATTLQIVAAINAATAEELQQIKNIGPVTAQAIVDHRNQYGPFQRPEDLLQISGIGKKTLQNIVDYFIGRLSNEDSGS